MALVLTLRRRVDDRVYFFDSDDQYIGDVEIAVGVGVGVWDGEREGVRLAFQAFDGIRILRSPHVVLDGNTPRPKFPTSAKRPQSVRTAADETRTPFGPESAS